MRRRLKTLLLTGLVFTATLGTLGPAMAGRTDGPGHSTTRVRSNATDSYRYTYREYELAVVVVIGDGDTDLDLYVYDADGNIVFKDDDNTDQ